jgi:N,N-dimethylformamidase
LVLRGYLDQLAVDPGSQLSIRLSSSDPSPSLRALKFRHSDPNPKGPGILEEHRDLLITRICSVRNEEVITGSVGLIPECFTEVTREFTFVTWVLPTRLNGLAVLASWQTDLGIAQIVITDGHLAVVTGEQIAAIAPHTLRERQWCFVAVSISEPDAVTLAWGVWGRTGGPYTLTRRPDQAAPIPLIGSPLLLGGALNGDGRPVGLFDGKISTPSLLHCQPDPIALMDLMNWGVEDAIGDTSILARWAFGSPGDLDRIVDLSGHNRNGTLLNAPSLGVSGPPLISCDSPHSLPQASPYQAVHFHRDDLDDCGWPETHVLKIPPDADSGFYVVRVAASDGEVDLPFVIRPSKPAQVLLLAPTFTWQAYANLGRDPDLYPGLSHYALHSDGSPVYISTRLKPMPGIGPAARIEVDGVDSFLAADPATPAGSVTHLLMADLYVNYWHGGGVRGHKRWGPACSRRSGARRLPYSRALGAPGVLDRRDARCARAIHRPRRQCHVPRRERPVLGDLSASFTPSPA